MFATLWNIGYAFAGFVMQDIRVSGAGGRRSRAREFRKLLGPLRINFGSSHVIFRKRTGAYLLFLITTTPLGAFRPSFDIY